MTRSRAAGPPTRPTTPRPHRPAPRAVLKAFDAGATPELVGRQCKLTMAPTISPIDAVATMGPIIAFASPNSTFAVTKRLIEAAKVSILIGIYDFTATYMADLLIAAVGRGVKVTLMLDLDGRTGETALYDRLATEGVECVPAPSCASKTVHVFASAHEKVIVIDGDWTLVQSGNWSENSIPRNETDGGDSAQWATGNRDMGVAVRSNALADFFTRVVRHDIDLEKNGAGPQAAGDGMADLPAIFTAQAAPPRRPIRTYSSKTFDLDTKIDIRPILSPENYLAIVPGLIASATRSVYVEQQYIRGTQPHVKALLDAIVSARAAHPKIDIRIIVAPPFPGSSFQREAAAIGALEASHGLVLGEQVRVLNPRYLVHCHNKLLIIDDERVLVSSQNWSDSAIGLNREAGLLLPSPPIARYFRKIFNVDWATGLHTVVAGARPVLGPEAVGTAGTVALDWGDYQIV